MNDGHARLALALWTIINGCDFAAIWAFFGIGWAFVALGVPHVIVLGALTVKVSGGRRK